ncbi:MAG TPA: hypothetical protein VGY53_12425, partial [Isosphaeraceae bacterium]|nr:hypothetical protein [Isosphaeraceae bacterium]
KARDALFEQLIASYDPEVLSELAGTRLTDLAGPEGEMILRLIAALDEPGLYDALAQALCNQTSLPADIDWEALELLNETGRLDAHPELGERWQELCEALDEAQPFEELVNQIEHDPEGLWLALEGLAPIEPEVRSEIIQGLAERDLGPGLIEFLRLLAFCHEARTRASALDVLAVANGDREALCAAWAKIAADHPDAAVAQQALARLGPQATRELAARPRIGSSQPRLASSLVSGVNGQGQAFVVVEAEHASRWSTAVFRCDVERGVFEVTGQLDVEHASARLLSDEVAEAAGRHCLVDRHELALKLLAGSLGLCGPDAPPSLQFWLEHTVGAGFRPAALFFHTRAESATARSREGLADCAQAVVSACPHWAERSELTYELAEEIAVRESSGPDPRRDASLYRRLFEQQLEPRVERYRRMLLWMAAFWDAGGIDALSQGALALAEDLAEGPGAVAGHPFFQAIITTSLEAAQAELRTGGGPRNAPAGSKAIDH